MTLKYRNPSGFCKFTEEVYDEMIVEKSELLLIKTSSSTV
jgi:hypothetical protein